MPQIVYVQPDGSRETVLANSGATVMMTAVNQGIAGIVAECGGSAMCATCHVYVDPESVGFLPHISEVESEMLASAASELQEHSRLSCQLVLAAGVDELIVHIPERQI
jgi:2Fe-2S ferredoxin